LYGAAQAAEKTGDKEKARQYYTQLDAQTAGSDGSRRELNRVREFLETDGSTTKKPTVVSARE
jgi:uncharacterized protein HemY